jgi:hypothetical protein
VTGLKLWTSTGGSRKLADLLRPPSRSAP